MDELEELVLETLSFLDPMTKEKLILDFDSDRLQQFPDFDKETLEKILKKLVKKKKIKLIKGADDSYLKIMPKRPWWKKIFS